MTILAIILTPLAKKILIIAAIVLVLFIALALWYLIAVVLPVAREMESHFKTFGHDL